MVRVFFIAFVFFFQILPSAFSQSEQITVGTYYPSPFGKYDYFRLFPRNNDLPDNICTSGEALGVMYYSLPKKKLMICKDITVGWEPLGESFWSQSGANLYPKDLSWQVGINTTTPDPDPNVKLKVGSQSGNTLYVRGDPIPGCTASWQGIYFHGDSISGYASGGSKPFDIRANPLYLQKTSGKNVGVGHFDPYVTSGPPAINYPGFPAPDEVFHVIGPTRAQIKGKSDFIRLDPNQTDLSPPQLRLQSTQNLYIDQIDSNGLVLTDPGDGPGHASVGIGLASGIAPTGLQIETLMDNDDHDTTNIRLGIVGNDPSILFELGYIGVTGIRNRWQMRHNREAGDDRLRIDFRNQPGATMMAFGDNGADPNSVVLLGDVYMPKQKTTYPLNWDPATQTGGVYGDINYRCENIAQGGSHGSYVCGIRIKREEIPPASDHWVESFAPICCN